MTYRQCHISAGFRSNQSVSDRGRYQPQPRLALQTDESGRGLSLLEMLAASWGARATADGKDVWFTLTL